MRILSVGIVRARDDSCNNAMNWRGTPLVDLATIVGLIGSTHSRSGLRVRSELDRSQYPGGITVTDARRCCMNTLWGWGRASWAGCGPDVRRGGQTLIMGYSADKSPLIGHLAGPLRRLEPLGAQRQEKCGPNRPTPTGYSCNNASIRRRVRDSVEWSGGASCSAKSRNSQMLSESAARHAIARSESRPSK